ncbi:MAG: hypothetical protein U1F08_00675 [Steroidobacteraceae bacterium]
MLALIIAAVALAAALLFLVVDRRRRARRIAEALERARRRHRRAPLVSANVRGLAAGPDGDLWTGELRERPGTVQVAPSSRDR